MREIFPFTDYRDLAYVLTEEYNGYASACEDYPLLEEDWVYLHLFRCFEPEDIELLANDHAGRMLMMGTLRTVFDMESVQDDET